MAARTVPTLPTFTTGQVLTSGEMTQLITWMQFWANPPMFRMYQTISQSVPNTTDTQVTCDTSDYDTDSGRAIASPWSYTIPVTMAGRWRFAGAVLYVANATGLRLTSIRKNGLVLPNGGVVGGSGVSGNSHGYFNSVEVVCAAGDVISLWTYQSSGGALATDATAAAGLSFLEGRYVSLANP